MIRINLISSPRNISTALMYSFAQRSDTTVLDEPYYAYYLVKSGVDHPGKEEVVNSQPNEEEKVTKVIFNQWDKPVLFIKNMAHHIELMDEAFLDKVINVFLIRNPGQIIASYAQVIEKPVMRDIGIEYQYNLFSRLRAKGQKPVVLDSGLLLQDPVSVLRQLCNTIGIPFETQMLTWQPGPKPFDGVWATHWYANVHQSSGFEKQQTSSRPLPEHLVSLYEHAKVFYEKLIPFSLKP
ncbi:MAG: sulfotransferase family protein [Cyclobacteriaceae bacterium]|nr:sulfotransferase family protein [Cyclobacteriaceae bacterium]